MGKIPAFDPEGGQPGGLGNSGWKRMQKHRKPSQMGYISYLPKCKMVVPGSLKKQAVERRHLASHTYIGVL